MTPNEIIDGILRREGGFVDHPADKGGPTKYGITQAALAEWLGRPATVDDVKQLSEHEAREIYREQYIVRPGFLGIDNDAVRALAIDCAVNHGVKRAVQLLQEAARVFTDGIFGPNTKDAVNRMTAAVLYRRLCAARVRLYGQIITKNPSQAVFAAGWCNRVAEFIQESA
jgi:lysozyme family protein